MIVPLHLQKLTTQLNNEEIDHILYCLDELVYDLNNTEYAIHQSILHKLGGSPAVDSLRSVYLPAQQGDGAAMITSVQK